MWYPPSKELQKWKGTVPSSQKWKNTHILDKVSLRKYLWILPQLRARNVMFCIMFSLSVCHLKNYIYEGLRVPFANSHQFSSVTQLCPNLCDPWTAACQASQSINKSRGLLKLMFIELVMQSNHLIPVIPFSCLQFCPASGSFQWVSSLHQVAKVLAFQLQHQSFWRIFRTDFF